jgi:TonB family protein
MFENFLIPPKKKGWLTRDIAVGAVVTILFHALLGFLIYYGRFTVRFFPSAKEEVQTVLIVPPLKVTIPRIVGGRGLSEVPGGPRESASSLREPEEVRTKPEAEPEVPVPEGEAARTPGQWIVPPPGSGSAIPSLSSKFRESITTHGKSGLTIPLAPPGTPPGPPGVGAGAPLPDFSKYGRGAYGGGVGGYGSGRGGTGTGGVGRQRVGMSIPLKGYNLMPWATAVIDRLQVNWTLPAVAGVPDAAKISMIVVIKKTGELDSIEILEGTSLEVLDRAALDAIRISLPFPALPDDFPGDLLEITLDFVYDD